MVIPHRAHETSLQRVSWVLCEMTKIVIFSLIIIALKIVIVPTKNKKTYGWYGRCWRCGVSGRCCKSSGASLSAG